MYVFYDPQPAQKAIFTYRQMCGLVPSMGKGMMPNLPAMKQQVGTLRMAQ